MRLIVYLKPSPQIRELSKYCDVAPRDGSEQGYWASVRRLGELGEAHVRQFAEVVRNAIFKALGREATIEEIPIALSLVVECRDEEVGQLRESIATSCDNIAGITEDLPMELIDGVDTGADHAF